MVTGERVDEQGYKSQTGMVVPRTMAWITTLSSDEVDKLAPLTAGTFVSPKQQMLAIRGGGFGETNVKALKGARLATPSDESVVTHAIGLGTTIPVRSL